jgi:CubicO group peptidase (beta-lactamase class C family)
MRTIFLVGFLALCSGQILHGPGRGPWRVARPEDHGLTTAALDAAETQTNANVGGRTCYIVIKNGEMVYERYRGGRTAATRSAAWSCTKSMCSTLYGIAVEQGWANVNDLVRNRNRGTRQCNRDATFQHVLTMTGQSANIAQPRFSYDTTGDGCLDTISDFITENNPQGLGAFAWKNRFWQDILGVQDGFVWGSTAGLRCGYSVETSCRDLARTALLWANEGGWNGAGQLVNRAYMQRGGQWVYPTSGTDYGYTVWRSSNDPVDNQVNSYNGMFSQCAYISRRHAAVVVSMGTGEITGGQCANAWAATRNAVISRDDLNGTMDDILADMEPIDASGIGQEVLSYDEVVATMENALKEAPERISEQELQLYKEYLAGHAAQNHASQQVPVQLPEDA